ncbi:MAG: hypothetical protein ACRCWI_08190 [Brevinema sp.]
MIISDAYQKQKKTTKILQIGAGNFLRAFLDYAVQLLNDDHYFDGGILIGTSSAQKTPNLRGQNGLYTLILGDQNGIHHHIIDVVQDQFSITDEFDFFLETATDTNINIIFSNTTEIGISYQQEEYSHTVRSFPARLTLWLERRFQTLYKTNSLQEPLFIIPCELIESNGTTLKKIIKQHSIYWELSKDFLLWVDNHVHTYDTLVDRMVPGYPSAEIPTLAYHDPMAVFSETFFFMAIQGNTVLLDRYLPLSKSSLDIIYTDDLEYYFRRKVFFLNGSHTAILALSVLLGYHTVQESLKDPDILAYLKLYHNTALSVLESQEHSFIESVLNRFNNPYLSHHWSSIALNAHSKIQVRNMPIVDLSQREQILITLLPLAALWAMYYQGIHFDNDPIYKEYVEFLQSNPSIEELTQTVLPSQYQHWQEIFIQLVKNLISSPRTYLQQIH